jgi:multiple sugar transport system substrate-binding protein
MRSAKRLSSAALLGVIALTATACSSGETPPQATEDIELRMTIWTSNEDHLALFDDIADSYMADHPEVTSISFDPLPFEDYTTTVTTQIAGGNAPDLAWVLENAAPDFVSSGALAPLTETLEASEGYAFDDLSPAALELWQEDDVLYGIPFSNSPFGVFVNNTLLEEAGQPTAAEMIADGTWTWDEVSAVGAAVNEETGKDGFVVRDFDYQLWDYLSTVWEGWDAQPWSEDGATCEFDSPEMIDAFTFLHDAAFDNKSMPGPGTSVDFFTGDAAFTVTQISRANLIDDSFEWDLVPLPAGPAGEYAVLGQGGVGVIAQGDNVDAATDFLAYFTNPENAEKLAAYFPPPRESLLTVDTLAAANPTLSPEQIETVVIDAIETGTVRPSHVGQAEIAQQVRAGLDELWVEDADIPAVLGSVCDAIDPLLEG